MRLIDDQTFETVDVLPLHRYEMACSCVSLTLADDPNPYYVVGTAYAIPDEQEPTKVARTPVACLALFFSLLTALLQAWLVSMVFAFQSACYCALYSVQTL